MWRSADCPTGYTLYDGTNPTTPNPTCIVLQNYYSNAAAIARIPDTSMCGTENPRASATPLLQSLEDHRSTVSTLMTNLQSKTTLSALGTGITGGLSAVETLRASVATQVGSLMTKIDPIFQPALLSATNSYNRSNCTFVKNTLLNIGLELPNVKSRLEVICLLGLGIVSAVVFINLTGCILGQFKLAQPEYYTELKEMEKEAAGKEPEKEKSEMSQTQPTTAISQKKTMVSNTSAPKKESVKSEALKPATIAAPTVAIAGAPNSNSEKVQSDDPNNKYKQLKKVVAPSSKKFGASFFAPKPTKPNQVRPADVERALDDLKTAPKTNRLDQVDDKMIARFRDRGLLDEFNKPLRNYVVEDTVSGKGGKKK